MAPACAGTVARAVVADGEFAVPNPGLLVTTIRHPAGEVATAPAG